MHECINHELEYDLKNPYIPIEEKIVDMLDERDDESDHDSLKKWTLCELVMW
jgi:hypothetical protein